MVELLVTIVIIGIMAGMVLGALNAARNTAREAATKATIAKLNAIVMQKYESFMTRRVPIQIPPGTPPQLAAWMRLDAIRDLMRMEMPERWVDVSKMPAQFPARTQTINGVLYSTGPYVVPQPALHRLYQAKYQPNPADEGSITVKQNDDLSHAKCLFMVVSLGNPEAMEQFSQSEIATDSDGWQYFVDGWGKPIFFLRWAPGFSNWEGVASPPTPAGYSQIQTGNPTTDHDPFDSRNLEPNAYRLIPLIFSFGRTGEPNLDMGKDAYYGNASGATAWTVMDPYQGTPLFGTPATSAGASASGNITNHLIEQR